MAIFLLLSAVLLLVYSPWSQNDMRRFAVEMMNRNGLKTEIAALRLKFPLDIEVEGLKLDMPGQAISAGRLEASVEVLPLLTGHARLSEAILDSASFTIGTPDSAMYMTINGRSLKLNKADVALASMDINLEAIRQPSPPR